MKPAIALRIVVVDPPTDVAFALQRGRSELQPAARQSRNELAFAVRMDGDAGCLTEFAGDDMTANEA